MTCFSKKKDSEKAPGDSVLYEDSGILRIFCDGCDQYPDACSPLCIRCICEAIARDGAADRIELTAGKDIEISGKAAGILNDLARVNRPIPIIPTGRGCSRCPRNPGRIMDSAWSDFPDVSFSSACARLYTDSRDGPDCAACMQRTYAALNSAEEEMKSIREKVVKLSSCRGVSC